MDYDTFIREVQNRGRLSSREDAIRATRITLETLSQRIDQDAAENLGAQLPDDVGQFLANGDTVEQFDWNEFMDRIIEQGEYTPDDDREEAVHHTRAVIDVVDDAVTVGAIETLHDQLSSGDNWNELFKLIDQE